MTDALLDPLRHNSWATGQLLRFCGHLTAEQLRATAPGTYGTVLATMQHILGAEGRYRRRLSGAEPSWSRKPEETEDLEELARMAQDMAAFWEGFAARPFDPERTIRSTFADSGEDFEVKAGVLVAQTLNHGNEHRAQISTILSTVGIEPPELDGWSYGEATGRFTTRPRN